jgi:hypothetical protein
VEADTITPLDVKVELVIALVFLMVASAKSYMSNLRVINVTNQYISKTPEQVFQRRNMQSVRRTRGHLFSVPAFSSELAKHP